MNDIKACCDMMAHQIDEDTCVGYHGVRCPDKVIVRVAKRYLEDEDEWIPEGLQLRAVNASWSFRYCPWCGTKIQPEGTEGEAIEPPDVDYRDPEWVALSGFENCES